MTQQIEELRQRAENAGTELETLRGELKSERAGHQQTLAARDGKEAELTTRIAELQAESEAATKTLEQARSELAQQEQRCDELEKAAHDHQGALKQRIEEVEKTSVAATADLETLRTELQKEQELRAGIETREKETTDQLKNRIRQLEEGSATSTEQLKKRLAINAGSLSQAKRELATRRYEHDQLTANASRTEKELLEQIRILTASAARPSEWFLKLDDDSVFGPVSLSELRNWAADCRIGPDHRVSSDKQQWLQAKEVPGLRMEWMVKLLNGTAYGPLNIFAAHHLLLDGVIDEKMPLVNSRTGENLVTDKLLAPDVIEIQTHSKKLADELSRTNELLAAEKERTRDLERRLAELEKPRTSSAVRQNAPPKSIRQRFDSCGLRS